MTDTDNQDDAQASGPVGALVRFDGLIGRVEQALVAFFLALLIGIGAYQAVIGIILGNKPAWADEYLRFMGANLVNTVAEGLAPALAEIAGGRVGLRILSNLCDQRRVRVTCRVPDAALVCNQQVDGAAVRESIVAASRFAELDPYRAATHNKGLMQDEMSSIIVRYLQRTSE